MERDAFHVAYMSDKMPEDAFHSQDVNPVAYLRVSTAQDAAAHFDRLRHETHNG